MWRIAQKIPNVMPAIMREIDSNAPAELPLAMRTRGRYRGKPNPEVIV